MTVAGDAFPEAFAATIGEEGKFTDDSRDPGNWTGGKIGVGKLRGTKWGISAAAYPNLDIERLTLDDARALYLRDYWREAGCDRLVRPLALALFDAAVNSGVGGGVAMLQRAVEVEADGACGPRTLAAVQRAQAALGLAELLARFHAERLLWMAAASTFRFYGKGWFRRVLRRHQQLAGA